MYVSPIFIEQSIIARLKIKSCNECDRLRNDFHNWGPKKYQWKRSEFGYRYECNSKKCDGLVSSRYLVTNSCIVLGRKLSDNQISAEIEKNTKFNPHPRVIEVPSKRNNSNTRRETMYKPEEFPIC